MKTPTPNAETLKAMQRKFTEIADAMNARKELPYLVSWFGEDMRHNPNRPMFEAIERFVSHCESAGGDPLANRTYSIWDSRTGRYLTSVVMDRGQVEKLSESTPEGHFRAGDVQEIVAAGIEPGRTVYAV